MTAKTSFRGSFTALVTPFKNGSVDEKAFRALVDWCIAQRKTVIILTVVAFLLGIFGMNDASVLAIGRQTRRNLYARFGIVAVSEDEQLAAVEILRGDYAGAIAEYQKLPIPVQDGVLASNIASAYFFLRRIGEAKRFYVLAATLEPRNPSFRQNLGDLYVRAGEPDSARYQYAEAVRLLEDLLHVDPHNVMVQLDRATCLAKQGECAQALDALHRVAASLPANDAECAHLVAKLQALCGRRAEAVAAVRRAVDLGISASLIRDEDEFVALAGDPMFKSIARRK